MKALINFSFYIQLACLICIIWLARTDAISCDSCGRECSNACGTKYFRTCCFNYLRKRSSPIKIDGISHSNTGIKTSKEIEGKLKEWLDLTKDMANALQRALFIEKYKFNKIEHPDNFSDEFSQKKILE